MSYLPSTREEQLSQLIGCTIAQLDISEADFLAAKQRYDDLGAHLADQGAYIYVQGSTALGTVISPYGRSGEYDLDLVCLVDVRKASITQAALKERVGGYLDEYIDQASGDDVPKSVSDGRRAWTLHYDRFHMDVLPAILDADVDSPTAIELTDKKLRHWQKSDPPAYVAWFRQQCAQQLLAKREAMAAGGSVEDVPLWRVRTPLHRVVQVLKRHRDLAFALDPGKAPPSSLITTLAARAYAGEQDLLAALLAVVQRMPKHIENRNGVEWVENPVCEGENFADKWREYPERRQAFAQWHAALCRDLQELIGEHGGQLAVHERLGSWLGTDQVREAAGVLAGQTRGIREKGKLAVTTSGLLTTGAGTPTRDHVFFGGPASA
ncbi:MAG: hypothetical protein JWL64_37 [Frankiales bacterium]|nr:hypothetical protein [Frankiales bacterium]